MQWPRIQRSIRRVVCVFEKTVMKMKKILSALTIMFFVSDNSFASDLVTAEPEPVEYVRVCDAYGIGYFYIPGTETCMRLSGYVRADLKGGDNVYAYKGRKDRDTYAWRGRADLRFETVTGTDFGALRTFVGLRAQWDDGTDTINSQLRFGYIQLGGLRVGVDESIFWHWTGYLGKVVNDDIIDPGAYQRTNVISYTFASATGFSAVLGFEQGSNGGSDNSGENYYYIDSDRRVGPDRGISIKGQPGVRHFHSGSLIDNYTPNILLGAKYVQGWGSVAAIGVYDSQWGGWAAKLRVNVDVTDYLSLWLMGGYKTNHDYYAYDADYIARHKNSNRIYYYRMHTSQYGDWGGHWIIWGGSSYSLTQKASFNTQLTFDETSTFSASANVAYTLTPGLTLTPELSFINYGNKKKWNDDARIPFAGENSFQGAIRLQRNF